MLGHQGPTGGDPLVAELLRRTYDGTKDALARFDKAKADFLSGPTSVYELPFPQMTLLQSYWMALVYWEISTAYTDGMIVTYQNENQFPDGIYEYGDSLCDLASSYNRDAITLSSEYADRGKITMRELVSAGVMDVAESAVLGQWNMGLAIINRVQKDLKFLNQKVIPKRLIDVHESLTRQMKLQMDVVAALKRDWRMTTMLDNRCDLTVELDKHARTALEIGQKLWAPYHIGHEYTEALKRKPSLTELAQEFDPWALTDPAKRMEVEKRPAAAKELAEFWGSLADRGAVIALAKQVDEALKKKVLRRRSSYDEVPWPSQFLVRSAITFGGRNFECGHLCSYFITEDDAGQKVVEMRRSGRLTGILDLMGQ